MSARRPLALGLLGLGAVGAAALAARYRRDLAGARARLAGVDRQAVPTRAGPAEVAQRGVGRPLLVSHGILQGADGGLLAARDVVPDAWVIAPSRFGYLGSVLPTDATVAGQVDALIDVLDHLGVASADVLGVSAGTTAAVALALAHPDRVDHLVISSGSWPGSPTAVAPPGWARALYCDPALWLLKVLGDRALGALMGVPEGFPRDDAERRRLDELVESIFPVAPRAAGAAFDAYVGNPAIAELPLEDLAVPTLVLHARDDPLASFAAAEDAVARIPGARLVALDSGGHLGLGQVERTRAAIADLLA